MTAPLLGHAIIQIRPQFTSFAAPLNQEFRRNAPQFDRHGRDAGAHFTSGFGARIRAGPFRTFGGMIGSGLALGITGALAGGAFVGVFKALKVGAGEVKDFSAGLAQTNAVLTSTGGAAHVTAGHVEDLASTIQGYSGITDDSVVASEDMLLTFTKVRNEVGKGNDIFDQATRTVTDMSKALGEDSKSAAIQLGKALNDPIRGVTALQRVGVTFDESQKQQIATLVKHGHTLEAQKIILAELGKEFGGTARAFGQSGPGQIERAKRAFEDVSQSLVGTLLPVFNRVIPIVTAGIKGIPVAAAWVGRQVGPTFHTIGVGVHAMFGAFREGDVTSRGFVGIMERIGVGARLLVIGVKAMFSAFREGDVTSSGFVGVMERIGVTLMRGKQLVTGWIPAVKSTGETVLHWLIPSFRMIGQFVTGSVLPSLRNLAAIFTGTVLPAIKTVAPIVGGALLIGFRAVAFLLRDVFGPVLRGVTGFVRQHQTIVAAAVITIGTFVLVVKAVTVAQKLWAAGTLLVRNAVLAARTAMFLFNVILAANPIGIVVTALIALAAGLVYAYKHSETFRRIVDAAFRVVKAVIVGVWTWIKANWPLLLGILTGPVGMAVVLIVKNWDKIKSTFSTMWDGLKHLVRVGVAAVVDFFLGMVSPIVHGAATAFGWIPGIGGKLKSAAAAFDKFRDDTNKALLGVQNRAVTVTATLGTIGGGHVYAQASGGVMRFFGAGSENHIAQVAPANAIRVWAEPETGGEAYIPLAANKRGRSTAILTSVASAFGYNLMPMADGGLTINPRLAGLARFQVAIEKFNAAVDKLAASSLAGVARVLGFASQHVGAPYVWGAAGPGGWDCSGWISSLVNVALGRSPYRRLFSTDTLPGGYFAPGLRGKFDIGWFRGNPGHVAGTVGGVNVESAGGVGVRIGPGARGARSSLFTQHGHLIGFAGGGIHLPGDPPFDLLDRRGGSYRRGLAELLQGVQRYDAAGGRRWPTGTLGVNTSGEDEYVWRGSQLRRNAGLGPLIVQVDARGAADPAAIRAAVAAGGAELMSQLSRMLATGVT